MKSVVIETSANWDLGIRIVVIYHVQSLVLKHFIFI